MIYALFLPYKAWDILGFDADELTSEEYPVAFRRVRVYDNAQQALDAFANTPCPASQLIEAETSEELAAKVEEMHSNFDNPEWIAKYIDPYI